MMRSAQIRLRSLWHESPIGRLWLAHRQGDVFHLATGEDWLQRLLHRIRISRVYFWWLQRQQSVAEPAFFAAPSGQTPPYTVKRRHLQELARKHGCRVLVETGSYFGDTPFALRNDFSKIHSVEISEYLHQWCRIRFCNSGHIHLWQGDSAQVLPKILAGLTEPAIFWLDGHCSGGVTSQGEDYSPILEELRLILDHPVKNHILAIDDARLFLGKEGYPTVQQVSELIQSRLPLHRVHVKHDAILAEPESTSQCADT